MSLNDDLTTLVCLFHDEDRAQSAFTDLTKTGIPAGSITRIGGPGAASDVLEKSELASIGMPDKDYDHLKDGIRRGGVVVSVSAAAGKAQAVEAIFHKYSAGKIDEASKETTGALPVAAAAAPVAAQDINAQTVIPIVEENLVLDKRTVNQGGVRVFRHVVEIPVEASIGLREEHVTMERRPVNRAVTDMDTAFGDRTIELTETAEQAVVSKNARVVEELLVGKTATERTETVRDTVRHTEVDVEEIPGTANTTDTLRRGN